MTKKYNTLYNFYLSESTKDKYKEVHVDLIRGSGANVETDEKIQKYSNKMKEFGSYGNFPPIKASLETVDDFDIEEYQDADERGYGHELAWSREISSKDKGKNYLSIYDGHHRALAALENNYPIKYIDPSKNLNEGWYDSDEVETIKITLEDMLLVKKSIDKTLEDIFQNRKSKTSGEIEVWKVENKFLIIDGWHRFIETALKNKKEFIVKVVGDGYSNDYVTNFDANDLYSTKEFIETIKEWNE